MSELNVIQSSYHNILQIKLASSPNGWIFFMLIIFLKRRIV